MPRIPLRAALAAAVGALVVASSVALALNVGGDDAPRAVAAPTLRPTPVPVPPTTPAPTPTPTTSPTPTLPRLAADSVAIPRQHVVAPIDVCDIVDGGLEPPADVHRTCRWAGGAPVAAAVGTTVITGHINWVGQGTGALGRIDRLHRGDTVFTAGPHATVTEWRIVRVTHRSKTTGIDQSAFVGRSGPRQLYLISCGGAFDAAEASYEDNIYVLATPVASRPPSTPPAHGSA